MHCCMWRPHADQQLNSGTSPRHSPSVCRADCLAAADASFVLVVRAFSS